MEREMEMGNAAEWAGAIAAFLAVLFALLKDELIY